MSTMILQQPGCSVVSAGMPHEAIRVARESSTEIHLLLADVIMPEMNGRDPASRIQNIRPKMKHSFMSGVTDAVIAHQGVLEKGVHFEQKPFF